MATHWGAVQVATTWSGGVPGFSAGVPARTFPDVTASFHTYGGLITPTYAAGYSDGNLIWTNDDWRAGREFR
jgi:hypothetical protein